MEKAIANFPQWKLDNPEVKKHNQVTCYMNTLDIEGVGSFSLRKYLAGTLTLAKGDQCGGYSSTVPATISQSFCKHIVTTTTYTLAELYQAGPCNGRGEGKGKKPSIIMEMAKKEFRKKKHGLTITPEQLRTHVRKPMKEYLKELFAKKKASDDDSDDEDGSGDAV